MEAFRASPRQADLLIVSGRVSHKMAAPLRQIYDQMLEPKWVIAMGACASSGGMFNNYAILQGVDRIVAVDIDVPGCPPRPEALWRASCRLHEKIQAGVPPAYELRRVADVSWEQVPGYVSEKDAYGETTVVDRARAYRRRRRSTCATPRASTCSPTSPLPTISAGERSASPATGEPRTGVTRTRPAHGASPSLRSRSRTVSPCRTTSSQSPRARRIRLQVWCDDGEPVPSVVSVWPTADWHEREQFDLMGIVFDGHPNLVRILMDEDWEGHPLRKDYPIGGEPVRFSEAE